MGDTQVNVFIDATTPLTIKQVEGVGTVLVRKDDEPGTALFLANDKPGKAGALAVLARLTAAVEALPDDTHAGQGVLPTAGFVQPMESPYSTTSSPTITAPMTTESPLCVSADVGSYRSMQILCTKPAEHEGEHENGEYTWPDPVWRTLTFGDLRVGDVVRLDEDGDEETVRASWPDRVPGYWWYRGSKTCGRPHNTDPVLVRHPRPEVGQ